MGTVSDIKTERHLKNRAVVTVTLDQLENTLANHGGSQQAALMMIISQAAARLKKCCSESDINQILESLQSASKSGRLMSEKDAYLDVLEECHRSQIEHVSKKHMSKSA